MAQATTAIRTVKKDIPFAWEGMDKKGQRVKGKSLAPNELALKQDLRRQGVVRQRSPLQRHIPTSIDRDRRKSPPAVSDPC